ncbi:MAG: response regulator [Candidatus Omnitrophota bacterium]
MALKQILIIDDDKEFCEELMESLRGEGYAVECVQDAVKGEDRIRSGSHDAVLLDCKMPVLTGFDILKRLKADSIRKHIFMLTGKPYTQQVLEEEDLSDMISGIIAKPVDFDKLLENIR